MTCIGGHYQCSLKNRAIKVKFVPDDKNIFKPQELSIEFMRTIRVPDNAGEAELPPSLGKFPLFKTRDYADRLPPEMVAKGGVFLPMYQKEALWINFKANAQFMIKIYAGGVNVVSGEHSKEDAATESRRSKLVEKGKSIQDYVIVPGQFWLDGIATSPGIVRQFVAMPMGQGYSVEGQLTGEEVVGGLQFEITPTTPSMTFSARVRKVHKEMQSRGRRDFTINCTDNNYQFSLPCSRTDPVDIIYQAVTDILKRVFIAMRLIIDGQVLKKGTLLGDYEIEHGSLMEAYFELAGGGGYHPIHGVAAGGKIKQNIQKDTEDVDLWMKDMTVTIPVQILNSAAFREVTGKAPPPCPIKASTYAKAGLPFFKMFEEPSSVSGNFNTVKSINQIEQDRGIVHASDGPVRPRLVELGQRGNGITIPSRSALSVRDPDALMNPDGPLRPFRTLTDLERDLDSRPLT